MRSRRDAGAGNRMVGYGFQLYAGYNAYQAFTDPQGRTWEGLAHALGVGLPFLSREYRQNLRQDLTSILHFPAM